MSLRGLCVHTLTLGTVTRTADGAGGWTESVDTTTVRGRIRPASARERLQWAGQPHVASHVVYVPAGVTVSSDQTIGFEVRTFRVLGVRDIDELGRYTIADCEEVD